MTHSQGDSAAIEPPPHSNGAINLVAHFEAASKVPDGQDPVDPCKHETALISVAEGDTGSEHLTAAHDVEPVDDAPSGEQHMAPQDEDHGGGPGENPEYDTGAPTDEGTPRASRNGAGRYHASMEQRKHLVATFNENPCPSVSTLNYLSDTIGMPMHNLVLWFKNRRARSKKIHRIPGQRRSYVKSGIYSRNRRPSSASSVSPTPLLVPPQAAQQQGILTEEGQHQPSALPQEGQDPQQQHQTASQLDDQQQPTSHLDEQQQSASQLGERLADQLQRQAVDEAQDTMLAHAEQTPRFEGLLEGDQKRPMPSGASEMPAAKRVRVGVDIGAPMEAGTGCRSWSSKQCLQAFTAFFDRTTGGMNPVQAMAARAVAEQFFIDEMHSGLTVTSVAQPLQTSLDVLDQLISKRAANGEEPGLSSGSRALIGEFIAQIRRGEAIAADPSENSGIGDGMTPQPPK